MKKVETMSICSYYISGEKELAAAEEMERRLDLLYHLPDVLSIDAESRAIKEEIEKEYNVKIRLDI